MRRNLLCGLASVAPLVTIIPLPAAAACIAGLLCAQACGSAEPAELHIDAELRPLFNLFMQDAARYGHSRKELLPDNTTLTIRQEVSLGAKKGNMVLGTCSGTKGSPVRVVKLRRDLLPEARKEVLFHELGHCLLGLDKHTAVGMMAAEVDSFCTTDEGWPACVEGMFERKGDR
jgi:hypothetical protein